MCVLVVKNKGVKIPSDSKLRAMFKVNPDGAGFCYALDGSIFIRKGIMTEKEFLKEVKTIPNKATAIIHARIGTSGGVSSSKTHPFVVSNNVSDIFTKETSQKIKKGYAVAHNGVFSGLGDNKKSDTQEFCQRFLFPLVWSGVDLVSVDYFDIIERLVGFNKVAILSVDGRARLFGSGWVFDTDGLIYSNKYFEYYDEEEWFYLQVNKQKEQEERGDGSILIN